MRLVEGLNWHVVIVIGMGSMGIGYASTVIGLKLGVGAVAMTATAFVVCFVWVYWALLLVRGAAKTKREYEEKRDRTIYL